MRVVQFQRRPNSTNHSIERAFASVRAALPGVTVQRHVCHFESRGVFKRLYNIIEAALVQEDVNHITGDVHYLALFLHKRRTLLTIHDCRGMLFETGIRKILYHWFWLKIPVSRSALVTVISEQTKQEVLRYTSCAESKIRVVADPVSSGFQPAIKKFDSSKPTFLQVGTGKNKNIERVARALSGIRCKLEIVGRPSPEAEEQLKASAVEYHWAADVPDEEMVEKYRASDAVLFCSTYEGFGMPVIEGNAVGRPVITSDLEPMRSVAGGAACLVDPYNIAAIRAGVLKVIKDGEYRARLVQRGFENAKRFSAEAIARSYMDVYAELMRADKEKRFRWFRWRPSLSGPRLWF